jgi:tetratricopeptide (TPR) repeat protein
MSPRTRLAVTTFVAFRIAVGLSVCILATLAPAAPPQSAPAARLVENALAREAQGSESGREQLLQAALSQSPDYAPARWHAGYVKVGVHWAKFDDAVKAAKANRARTAYRNARDKYPLTVAGQLELANWCLQKGLPEEARAHFTRVLELEPDQDEARAKLGFRRVDGVWLSEQEVTAARQRADRAVAAVKEWQPKLEALRKQFAGSSAAARDKAADEVRQIRDAAAIPAMELVLSAAGEKPAQLVVETLAGMSSYEASLALARHAVFSPWVFVRQEAALRLKARPVDHYVPALLSAVYTPIQSRAELYVTPTGRLMYRHMLLREGQQQQELAVFDTAYERIGMPGGDGRETLVRAAGQATRTAAERETAIAQQNAQQEELNDRICRLLSFTVGETLPSEPDSWWRWWSEYNDVFSPDGKPVRQTYRQTLVTVADRSTTGGTGVSGGARTYECLAAGTKVWTLAGPMAIEQIQVGDQVLAQNPHSGELAYKPVLRTTVRPEGPLVKLTTPSDTVRTSGGHPFWVSGRGWVKSRDLQAGAPLHTVGNVVRLRAAEKADAERTYNLVVADFHTYFVGEDLILSHDNTVREVTNSLVPGFAAR